MPSAKVRRAAVLCAVSIAGVGAVAMLGGVVRPGGHDLGRALVGEAREQALTLDLPQAVADVPVSQARVPGRPIVLIDPGHGGHDPGAISASGNAQEKALTLALSTELRDLLVQRGRVRVAMTRTDDRYLSLDQRAEIARRLGAGLFLSIHMDHAPNPLARGVTVYSLSDIASDAEAARFAAVENRAGGGLTSEADGSVRALLSDLAVRGEMEDSAALAERIVRRAAGPVLLRPRPHQFAAFHVLKRANTPAVLVEAGYISNIDDEAALVTPKGRSPLVLALAQAIEADLATRR
ncbi:MAG: N-acetylmuramoyl-L-alanine amidase [Sphingomonadales bacterium]|nr:N-acetylmuramoyl-L-alanine amidase [Sphingomonadales bacterium]